MLLAMALTIVLACLPVTGFAITPFAADVSVMTTKGQAADAIDRYLDTAFEYYLAGDAKNAYQCVSDGYYVVYEVTGFERQTLSYISGSRKNAVELEFSACKAAVRKENTEENHAIVRTELMKLKGMLREDANKLDARNDLPATVMTYWADGEQLTYDPYAELVGDTSAATRYATWAEAAEAVIGLLDTSK